jgi:hypothetical protein
VVDQFLRREQVVGREGTEGTGCRRPGTTSNWSDLLPTKLLETMTPGAASLMTTCIGAASGYG